jgi:hypothetical protein
VLPRALWSGGSGFAAQGSGRALAPRPGALGVALVMPRKTWSGPVLPPPKCPGVAMESCLDSHSALAPVGSSLNGRVRDSWQFAQQSVERRSN